MKTILNEIFIKKNSFVPMGEKMIPADHVKRKHFIPEYSRFKAGVYWADSGKCSPYPGYDITKNMTEEKAYNDLMDRVVKKMNPDKYTSIVVYMSTSSNVNIFEPNGRLAKNHNYELCCYMAGHPYRTERKMIYLPNGQVDIEKTIKANK